MRGEDCVVKSVIWSVVLAVAVCAQARTITVDCTGGGECRTIGAVMKLVAKGDVVLVKPGVYREEVRIPVGGVSKDRPTVLRSAVRGKAVVKGSDVWKNPWTKLGGGMKNVWSSPFDKSLFPVWTNSPYMRTISVSDRDRSRVARPVTNEVVDAETYLPRTLGQIFVDGAIMTEVTTIRELDGVPDTWMVSKDGEAVWLHPAENRLDPNACEIEWSVRNRCIGANRRGLADVVVDGFTVEHCANQGPFPQIGAIDVRSGCRWIVENNTVRFAKSAGITCGAETWGDWRNGEPWKEQRFPDMPDADQRLMFSKDCEIRYNRVSECGVHGIAAWNPGGAKIYCNVIERNNFGDYPEAGWEETAGIKIHGAPVVIANNVIRDNDAYGVWFDTGFTDTRCSGNFIASNRRGGIMFETCAGHALVDNNVIVGNRADEGHYYDGDGIYSHNGSGVTVAHNFIGFNGGVGVRFRTTYGRNGGMPDGVHTSSNRYVNNVFCDNGRGELMIASENKFCRGTVSDNNLYVLTGGQNGFNGTLSPFRFTYYNQGENSYSNLWRQCRDAGLDMGYGAWVEFGHPMELSVWQKVRGLDLHSRVIRQTEGKNAQIAYHELSAWFKIPVAAEDYRVPAIGGPLVDYLGAVYPAEGTPVRPGPFQTFRCAGKSGYYQALLPQILKTAPGHLKKK